MKPRTLPDGVQSTDTVLNAYLFNVTRLQLRALNW